MVLGIRPSIKFTMEEEENQQIAFMDIQVTREGNKLSTSVYRKKTHTKRYLNFHLHHHPRTLIGIVKTLKYIALNICQPGKQQEELQPLSEEMDIPTESLKQ